MKNQMIITGLLITSLSTTAIPAFAQAGVTMNQPDNGFFEGPSPEWATLHSTSMLGTSVHRQYHRDAVQKLLDWYQAHRSERGTRAYNDANRIFHQQRNEAHRAFHTADPLSK